MGRALRYKEVVGSNHATPIFIYIVFYHVRLLGCRCSQEWVAPLLRELGSSPKHDLCVYGVVA